MCLLCGTVEMGCVYCAVEAVSLSVVHVNLSP